MHRQFFTGDVDCVLLGAFPNPFSSRSGSVSKNLATESVALSDLPCYLGDPLGVSPKLVSAPPVSSAVIRPFS